MWKYDKGTVVDDNGRLIVYTEGGDFVRIDPEWLPAILAVPELVAALEKISRGEGAYSRDELEHATNCITEAVDTASEALALMKPKTKPEAV